MWTKEALKQLVRTRKFAVVVATVVSTATGSAGGYIFAKKRLEKKYMEMAQEQIEAAKIFYSQKSKSGEYADPIDLAAKYADEDDMSEEDRALMLEVKEALEELQYNPSAEVRVVAEVEQIEVTESIKKNMFDTHEESEVVLDFDLDDELEKKAKGEPYILEEEEYLEGASEYKQHALVWYEGDGVLASDEDDSVIQNVKRAIGEGNLRFGYGTKQQNLVYIRNDRLRAEYEITRSREKYSVVVGGFIEHSEKPTLRKFRDFD